ncbi:MAG TPA: hypothetical protein VII73_13040 [Caulobacteraceae bacterium]
MAPSDSDHQPASEKEARPDDDLPPTGDEARAQRTATLMPLIWSALGLLVVIAFVMVLLGRHGPPPTSDAASTPVPAAAAGPGR